MLGFKRWRRRRLHAQPFPTAWRTLLERNVLHYRRLDGDERERLERLVQIFIAEKRFEGAHGQAIDDEVRLTIAGHACLLLLGRDVDVYPALRSVVVYPRSYVAPTRWEDEGGLVTEEDEVRFGESWGYGTVVLSWREVQRARRGRDGTNVVLHEFAHQIGDAEGFADGVPRLPSQALDAAWERELAREYRALVAELDAGEESFIEPYAATDPGEFFAVVTELFFEEPRALRREHPKLYEQFRLFYGQDPAARLTRER